MAKAKTDQDKTPVTLIARDVLTPYAKNEVFTVPKYVADELMSQTRVDEDGNPVPVKVEVYDHSNPDHHAALVAQRGKDDWEPEKAKAEKPKEA